VISDFEIARVFSAARSDFLSVDNFNNLVACSV
jgi:hypothetical protein